MVKKKYRRKSSATNVIRRLFEEFIRDLENRRSNASGEKARVIQVGRREKM